MARFFDACKYAEAEPVDQRAVAISEASFGAEHPLVINLSNLSLVYLAQGRYREAEPLLRRALASAERDPRRSRSHRSSKIGGIYEKQGKYADAQRFHERALAIREKALGPEHPDVATSLGNLALAHNKQGQYTDAAAFDLRALTIREKVLGPEHRDVAVSLSNLAVDYEKGGRERQSRSTSEPWQSARRSWDRSIPRRPRTSTISECSTNYRAGTTRRSRFTSGR